MPVVAMPDGTQVSFPDEMPADQIKGLIAQKFPKEVAAIAKPPSNLSDAITDIPHKIYEAGSAAVGEINNAFNPYSDAAKQRQAKNLAGGNSFTDQLQSVKDVGAGLIAIPSLIASPITGAARSIIGHTFDVASPKFSDEQKAKLAAQGIQLVTGDEVADKAISGFAASRGGPSPVTLPPPSVPNPIVAAGQRLGVDVPRAIASDNMAVQRAGQGIRNIPIVGDAIPKATQNLTENLGNAVGNVASEFGSGSGPNVASRIGNNIRAVADQEASSAANAARQSDQAVMGAWERNQEAALGDIVSREATARTAAQTATGNMSPQEMGATLIQRLQTGEQEARALKEHLYGVAGASDGSIASSAVRQVRGTVAQALEDGGAVIDPSITAASSKMMDVLERLSNLNIPNKAVGARVAATGDSEIAAVNMQGIEQARKQLNFFANGATNDADRRAAGMIKRGFDDWLSHSFDNALFSGSDAALNSYRAARSANTDWRTRFGFNARDDADRIVNQIVTGAVTPQEVSNWVVGATKVGAKGVSSRLLTRITETTGGDQEALGAIRGGVWNRLSSATEGTDPKAAGKIANDISEFLHGSGSDVANRLFTADQQRLMDTYAQTLRRGADERTMVAEIGANTRPSAMEVGIGPMQKLASAVLGRNGKTDEALFAAIDAYAKSGSRGDINTLAGILKSVPQADKGDIAGAIIRKAGMSPRTGEFSPDVFASQWNTYTPQAKTVLFGNAGPQRQALDDIATISERLKKVGSRFGNPSGTAQNASFAGLITGLFAAPLTTISTALGGAVAAKVLSSPAGAASAAQWTRAYANFVMQKSARTAATLQIASRNLANTANGLGANVSPVDFIRALQSPAKSAAEPEQQPQPRPPGQ